MLVDLLAAVLVISVLYVIPITIVEFKARGRLIAKLESQLAQYTNEE